MGRQPPSSTVVGPERPPGIGLVCGVGALASLVVGFFALYFFVELVETVVLRRPSLLRVVFLALVVFVLASYFLAIAVAVYGLWTVRPWAWPLSILVFTLGGFWSLARVDVVPTVLSVSAVGYLFSRRTLFSRDTTRVFVEDR